jgi:hypothetical protein
VAVIIAVIALVICCKPRSKGELIPDKEVDMQSDPAGTAYTLSIEDGRELASDYDDFARVDAYPPTLDESDGGIFGGESDAADASVLPGRSPFGRAGRRSVIMRPLLSQF